MGNYIMGKTAFQGNHVDTKAVSLGKVFNKIKCIRNKLEYLEDPKAISFFPSILRYIFLHIL